MGAGPKKDKKFIQKIMAQIKSGVKELHVVDDKLGTPTYTHDFAAAVKKLIEHNVSGLYNIACNGETDRVEITREILRILNREKEIDINMVNSDFFRQEYFAPRPASERLVNRKLENSGIYFMRDWKTCLREYIERDYADNIIKG